MSADQSDERRHDTELSPETDIYRVFFDQSSEAIWRIEFDEPIDCALEPEKQTELIHRFGYIAECNKALAEMYDYSSRDEVVGRRLIEFHEHDDETNFGIVRLFVTSDYRLENGESHERDRSNNDKYFLNNALGILENGFLIRIWGSQRDITEQRITQLSQAHLAAIVESTNDAIISKDLDGLITSWNRAAEATFGFHAAEAIGQPVTIIAPPDLHWEEEKMVEQIRSGVPVQPFETIRHRKDGTPIYVSIAVSPIRNASGNIVGASNILRDITSERNARERLRESQEILALTVAGGQMGLWSRDLKTNAVWWSAELERLFGLEPGAFAGDEQAFYDLLHEDDREQVMNAVRAAVETRTDYTVEFRFRHSDGSERWMEGRGRAFYSESGEAIRTYGFAIDITERKTAERKLRESEELFVKAFNASPMVLTITSLSDGKLIEVNDTFERLSGFSREEAIGRTTAELDFWLNPSDRDLELGEVIKRGGIRDHEFQFKTRSGKEVTGLLSAELLDLRGQKCALTLIQDISERRRNEEIVRQSARQLSFVTDFAPVFIAHCDRDRRFRFVNRPYASRFGLTPAECIGRRIDEIIGEEAFAGISGYIDRVLEGEPVEFDVDLSYTKIGDHFMHCSYAPEFDDDGKVVGLVAALIDISERRVLEKAISENEEELRRMADSMPQVVWIASRDGTVTYYNNRAFEFAGGGQDEEGNWIWRPMIHPDDLAATEKAWIDAINSGDKYVMEHRVQMRNGPFRWHLSRAIPVRGDDGSIVRWYGTATDIEEIKQTSEALQESERRFRLMTNSAPMLVWMSGVDKLSSYVNKTWLDFTGRSIDEEVGNGWMRGIHPEDLNRCEAVYDESFETRSEFEIEYRLRRYDGEYRWILDKGVPLFSDQGEFRGYIGSCIDVTERRLGQEALVAAERRASEEYLELLSRIVPLAETLGTARDLISIYRTLQNFVTASMPCSAFIISFYNSWTQTRSAAFVWGEQGEVDISTLPNVPLTENGGPNSRAVFERRTIVVRDFMEELTDRPKHVIQENDSFPNSALVVPMTVMSRVIGTLEVQAYERDVFTSEHVIVIEMAANLAAAAIENVRLLQVEADARVTAEAANRAKDEFLSVLSHELRTPLNSMLGWTRMLKSGVLDAEKTKKAIEVIERNTLLQNNLIEDLLDVSRIISGKMRIDRVPVDLVCVFREVVDSLRPMALQKRLDFHDECADGPVYVSGDATRVQQIIFNLVQNAIKFTAPGGRIEVDLQRFGSDARLTVSDNGIGISSELLPHIFERFRQADSSTKRSFSGLGLGLTIVSNLVELHDGRLFASSEGEGMGATFTVEFPLREDFAKAAAERAAGKVQNGLLEGTSVLLVDDDVESLIPLEMFLEREGAKVTAVSNALAALDKISSARFDIVVTDIGMPGIDGYELISRLRESEHEGSATAVVALTAYASADDRRVALAAGFREHFAKPVDYDVLLKVLVEIRGVS